MAGSAEFRCAARISSRRRPSAAAVLSFRPFLPAAASRRARRERACPGQRLLAKVALQRIGVAARLIPLAGRECGIHGVTVEPQMAVREAILSQQLFAFAQRQRAFIGSLGGQRRGAEQSRADEGHPGLTRQGDAIRDQPASFVRSILDHPNQREQIEIGALVPSGSCRARERDALEKYRGSFFDLTADHQNLAYGLEHEDLPLHHPHAASEAQRYARFGNGAVQIEDILEAVGDHAAVDCLCLGQPVLLAQLDATLERL